MNPNDQEIEDLIIADISGSISKADKEQLDRLLALYADVRDRYSAISKRLTSGHTQEINQNRPAVEILLAKIKRRRRAIIFRRVVTLTAACLIGGAFLIALFWISLTQPTRKTLAMSTHVTLTINNENIPLDCQDCNNDIKGVKSKAHVLSFTNNTRYPTRTALLTVPASRDYKVMLPDGSEVSLNVASTIECPTTFNAPTREITITGQAFIKVSKNSNKPFIVHLPNSTVNVLGTEFAVNTYDSGVVVVSLTKGKVCMLGAGKNVELNPGLEATLTNNDIQTAPFDEEERLAWQSGTYHFTNEPIGEIAKVVERCYAVNIVVDPTISGKKLSSSFSRILDKEVETFLDRLKPFGISYSIEGKTIHLK
jgi:transmembrane sensor